jgi:hypothetical protein
MRADEEVSQMLRGTARRKRQWYHLRDAEQTRLRQRKAASRVGGRLLLRASPANGEGAKLRGRGPRAEAGAARRLPACESRDAGGVTPSRWR